MTFIIYKKTLIQNGQRTVLLTIIVSTEEGLDEIDIQDIIEDKFSFDEDLDEPKDIKKVKLAKKRELAKAKKFLNEQKDKYKVPLESSGDGLSKINKKDLTVRNTRGSKKRAITKRSDYYFLNKTDRFLTTISKVLILMLEKKNLD